MDVNDMPDTVWIKQDNSRPTYWLFEQPYFADGTPDTSYTQYIIASEVDKLIMRTITETSEAVRPTNDYDEPETIQYMFFGPMD